MILHFPVTTDQRDAQAYDSYLGVQFWRDGLTAEQFAERFPSATVIQFLPVLMLRRLRDRDAA